MFVVMLIRFFKSLPRGHPQLQLLSLYAGLSTDEQLMVFEPTPRGVRKVVISTNIAEVCKSDPLLTHYVHHSHQASVTIEGIKYVIDCGFVKVMQRFSYSKLPFFS